ncbi:asparagine synthase (glutamine-hydrolyzing) [Thalassospira sp.]|uniref:asparagine synthase (glutamine-hydrolyzing) n=1 Tax=Thalassospira sp. TaxID=1912094 RepID=UPI0027377812|nr:asparagine synthase (glutamine-hydrolyzing) [Thalassospira sp.]MDP2699706.1 asparagine synthase (glutamine-hydrolyzing) [Thalassospira sp.]
MCGIVGFVGTGNRADLETMTTALKHRGPDGEGFHIDPDRAVYLGHRRLAVRDISGGDQPMWNISGTIGVVYNGEIYNCDDLRAELCAAGYVFRTSHSDTEILVHGYAHWGTGLAERLNGMFAFAILDTDCNRLYLARDRFGEKPLYYAHQSGLFAFASELGSLTQHTKISRSLSSIALQKLFAYGYFPAPHTLYQNTAKLPGGHFMTVDLHSLEPVIQPYWQFTLAADDALTARDDEAIAEELRSLFIQAVGRRLVSDVPLGIFLSGGVDSSAILAAAAQHVDGSSLATFTIGFNEPSYDESSFASQVAKHVGSKHHLRVLDMEQARDLIPYVLSRMGEPLGDASLLPTHLLSAFTREHVTVALSGDGGDELFAGYDPFRALGPASLYNKCVPRTLHRFLRKIAGMLPHSNTNMSLDFKIRRTLMGLSQPQSAWAPAWMAPVDPESMVDLFDDPMRPEDLYSEAMELWESGPAKTRLDRLLQFFTILYLQDNILTKVDRASMMSSLETRAVFLDNDLVDLCCRLPAHFKYRNGERKFILKKALEPLLPHDIIYRRKKGFGIPLADWMRHVPQNPPLMPVPGMKMNWVKSAWDDHRQDKADHRLFLWTWLSLQHVLGTPLQTGAE